MSISLTPTIIQTDPTKYLHTTLYARRKEYLCPRSIRIKVGTWNVASLNIDKALKEWIRDCEDHQDDFDPRKRATNLRRKTESIANVLATTEDQFKHVVLGSGEAKQPPETKSLQEDVSNIDLYVIALQEIVDVTSPENYLRATDPKVPLNWKAHAQAALPIGYQLIASPQLIGVLLLVYASPEIQSQITSVASATVGTGLLGYVGNKGAAAVRIVLGETTRLVFVNCHLAAFQNGVDRRNWDYGEIAKKISFEKVKKEILAGFVCDEIPLDNDPETLDRADLIIWCGDLNYRIDLPNDEIRQSLEPFVPKEFPPTVPSESPTSPINFTPAPTPEFQESPKQRQERLRKVIHKLLANDQLYAQQNISKAFSGYREGQISFLPTYKYDVGTVGVFDSSEKLRAPSYCDRILWKMKDEEAKVSHKEAEKLELKRQDLERLKIDTDESAECKTNCNLDVSERPKRPRSTTLTVEDEDGEEDLVISTENVVVPHGALPPILQEEDEDENFVQISDESSSPNLGLNLKVLTYTSHQFVTASDHKPVTAIFSLTFPGVDVGLKSQVHAEVAKEVDRMENERRPAVTVIIEEDSDQQNPVSNSRDARDVEIVSLGEVRLCEIKEKKLTIANTGLVPAKVSFRKRPIIDDEFGEEREAICKNWLDVEFDDEHSIAVNAVTQGVELQPGEALTAFLRIHINFQDVHIMQTLNDGRENLEDILVLHVEDGKDMFLPVSGTWMQTCFGRSPLELVTIPEGKGGARSFFSGPKGTLQSETPILYSAPRELYKLTEHLLHKLKDIVEDDIQDARSVENQKWYSEVGWPFLEDTWGLKYGDDEDGDKRATLVFTITENLACDEEFGFESWSQEYTAEDIVEVMAEVLLGFLSTLHGRVIPVALYETVLKGAVDKKAAEKVLESLPTAASSVHANIFIYLTGFISELIATLSTTPASVTPILNLPANLPFSPSRDSFASAHSSSSANSDAPFQLKRTSTASSVSPSIISISSTARSTLIKNTARQALLKQRLAGVFSEVMIYKPSYKEPNVSVTSGKMTRQSITMALQQQVGRKGDEEKRRAFLAHFLEF